MLPLIPLIAYPIFAGSAVIIGWYHTLDAKQKNKYNEGTARLMIKIAKSRGIVPENWDDEEILSFLGKENTEQNERMKKEFDDIAEQMFRKKFDALSRSEAIKLFDASAS